MRRDRRRGFLLASSALLAVRLAWGQQARSPWKVGYLSGGSVSGDRTWIAAFQRGMRELGYVEGGSLVIEQRHADGRVDLLPKLAAELVALKVDIFVVFGATSARAADQASATIPVVMASTADPVGDGLVATLARPGGKITGLSDNHSELVAKRLQLLKDILPSSKQIGVLFNSSNPTMRRQAGEISAVASSLNLAVTSLPMTGAADVDAVLAGSARDSVNGVMILGDPTTQSLRRQIIAVSEKIKMPTMFTTPEGAEAGGLVSYGTNFEGLFHRAAAYVDRIFKGARPADMPVEQPTKFELVINLKTARALGIKVPQTILLRADRIIE